MNQTNLWFDGDGDLYLTDSSDKDHVENAIILKSERTENDCNFKSFFNNYYPKRAVPGTKVTIVIDNLGNAITKVDWPKEMEVGKLYRDSRGDYCTKLPNGEDVYFEGINDGVVFPVEEVG